VTDLQQRFSGHELVQLSDRAGTGDADLAIIEMALADAAAEINGYLAGRYALPLTVTPPIINRVACDIARYRLYDQAAPESVRERYEDARRLLEAVASGKAKLGLPATQEASHNPAHGAAYLGNPKILGRDQTEGF